ncbi:MAG: hypothetical protein AAFX50_22585, partial [Acidobacteriota bacterium]
SSSSVSSVGEQSNQKHRAFQRCRSEFPEVITLYDVDITEDSIRFAWGNSDFAQQLSGPTPDGS